MGRRSKVELIAHVVWAVKHREALLEAGEDAARIALFRAKAHDVGAVLLAAGCAVDHVHVLVRFPSAETLSNVVKRLKGASWRAHNLSFNDRLFRWQDGFWAQSCDPDDLNDVLAYVAGQRAHHALFPPPESWELILEDD